jgi:hypothetical protein
MWSHYADCHRGICIGFRQNYMKKIAALHQVRYRPRIPVVPKETPIRERQMAGFLQKGVDWAYEREWRVIRFATEEYVEFDPFAISEVYFGARTSDADKACVAKWLSMSKSKPSTKVLEFSGHAGKMRLRNICG